MKRMGADGKMGRRLAARGVAVLVSVSLVLGNGISAAAAGGPEKDENVYANLNQTAVWTACTW